jgi:hypothetical protein
MVEVLAGGKEEQLQVVDDHHQFGPEVVDTAHGRVHARCRGEAIGDRHRGPRSEKQRSRDDHGEDRDRDDRQEARPAPSVEQQELGDEERHRQGEGVLLGAEGEQRCSQHAEVEESASVSAGGRVATQSPHHEEDDGQQVEERREGRHPLDHVGHGLRPERMSREEGSREKGDGRGGLRENRSPETWSSECQVRQGEHEEDVREVNEKV